MHSEHKSVCLLITTDLCECTRLAWLSSSDDVAWFSVRVDMPLRASACGIRICNECMCICICVPLLSGVCVLFVSVRALCVCYVCADFSECAYEQMNESGNVRTNKRVVLLYIIYVWCLHTYKLLRLAAYS